MFSGGPGALVQYGLRSTVSAMSLASRKDIQSAKSSVIRQYLKTGVSRKQSTPNFPKNEHFLPPDTHGVRYVHFQKIWRAFFSWKTQFEIRPFCLITDKVSSINLAFRNLKKQVNYPVIILTWPWIIM